MKNEFEKFKIKNPDTSLQEETERALMDLHDRHTQSEEQTREESMSIEEALDKGAAEKLKQVFELIKVNLKKRGVKNPNITPVVFMKYAVVDKPGRGFSGLKYIEIYDSLITDKSLKQLVTFKAIAHEAYHSVGKLSVAIKTDKKNPEKVKLNVEASGAGYREARGKSALEEGAAMFFESETFDDIKNLFPKKTVEQYNRLIKTGIDSFREKNKNVDIGQDSVTLLSNRNQELFLTRTYHHPIELVKYLKTKVEGFDEKLEKLRVDRRSLDMVRALEQKFGEGMFRKIVTCEVGKAEELLEELKSIEK